MKVESIKEQEDGSAILNIEDFTEQEISMFIDIGYALSCYIEEDDDICIENAIEYILMLEVINSEMDKK